MDLQDFKLVIANPCSEDWNSMRPTETGRHCLSCRKTVLDFSSMTDENIKAFFIENAGKSICGRFKKEQIERVRIYLPANIFSRRIAAWKKFLAVLLIFFGGILFSADVVWGNPPFQSEQTQQTKDKKKKDKPVKKLKKKYRIKKSSYEIIKGTFTSGLIGVIPNYPINDWVVLNLPNRDTLPIIEKNKKQEVDSAILSADLDLSKKGNDDVPKKDKSPKNVEFILPAPLALRMRRKPAK